MLWQTIVYGFAGISPALHAEVLTLDPHLPSHWRSLRFPFVWRGNRFDVAIDDAHVTIRNCGPRDIVRAIVRGEAKHISKQAAETWDLAS
jgi:trehalose/maltose hydrolase-like predicted phosphorylase